MRRRREVASAYVNGDAAPLCELLSRDGPSSSFGPSAAVLQGAGAVVQGASAVRDAYERGAQSFAPGGETELDVLHHAASGDLGYWVGIQRALLRVPGKPEPVKMALRVSEIFRRIDGEWRLLHRHADPLPEPAPRQATLPADGGDGGSAIRANESAATSAGPPLGTSG